MVTHSRVSISPGQVVSTQEVIHLRGKPVECDGIRVGDQTLILERGLVTTARPKNKWYDEVADPEKIIAALKSAQPKPDLFTFWQRLPDLEPLHPYHHEAEVLSAVRIHSFDEWWTKQIKGKIRTNARYAEKHGVEIRVEELSDDYVRGVMEVFDETPVRRGKPFWHYQKNFETVKSDLERDLPHSEFIGAYLGGRMVGFVKLMYVEGRFANPGLIISKIEHRKKHLNDALIAKSVELCARRGVPYLTYTQWRRGSHAAFHRRHGFRPTPVPRYWVPLTRCGSLALKLGLHRGLRSKIPDGMMKLLLDARSRFYARKHPL